MTRRKKKRKLKKKIKKIVIILFLIIALFIGYEIVKVNKGNVVQEILEKDKEKKLNNEYNTCLTKKFEEDELNETLQAKIVELQGLLSKYRVSVAYEDIMTSFEFKYNSKVVYYAASTIKMLDAIYVVDKYLNEELDINKGILYDSKYSTVSNSPFLKKQQVGSYISIKDLVKNAVILSDNGAHIMLYDYFGYNSMKTYANELGATNAFAGDQYGSISINDALIYTKKLYELINKNEEFGAELKSWFIESNENYVNTEETKAAVKYGGYNEYFHNIGIVYDTNPYYLVILSSNGNGKSGNMVKEISAKIKELHDLFYSNRQEYCTFKVYNQS